MNHYEVYKVNFSTYPHRSSRSRAVRAKSMEEAERNLRLLIPGACVRRVSRRCEGLVVIPGLKRQGIEDVVRRCRSYSPDRFCCRHRPREGADHRKQEPKWGLMS